jgi:HK97 family phage prohead protease
VLTKSLKLRLKELDETGKFVGISSVYGNRDLGGDVMVKGAFTKTLQENAGRFPLLYGHKVNVGVSYCEDTDEGLQVTGMLNLEKQVARDVYSDMKFYKSHGLDFGMSIGYMTVAGKTEDRNGSRYLKEVALFENTLTEMPMNQRARVSEVKAAVLAHKGDFVTDLDAIETFQKRYNMLNALDSSLSSILFDEKLASDEKLTRLADTVAQFSDAFLEFVPKYLALLESRYKDALATVETKDGRPAFGESVVNEFRSLLTAAEQVKGSEPMVNHSELAAGADRVLAALKSLAA